jgi:hypothetical protein
VSYSYQSLIHQVIHIQWGLDTKPGRIFFTTDSSCHKGMELPLPWGAWHPRVEEPLLIAPCAIVNDSDPRYDHPPASIASCHSSASVGMAANSDVQFRKFVH